MAKPILIIEDDEIACLGLSTILQADGHDTVTASNGREALDRLKDGLQPALILLDMILPGCDGWQFCAHRKSSHAELVPMVIMTGLGIASDDWAKSMGAVAVMRKPLDIDSLLTIVRQHL
jgi:CheY-like chemotaxis protein